MRWMILTILLCYTLSASAQESVDNYVQEWLEEQRDESERIHSDTLLFYRAAQNSRDIFEIPFVILDSVYIVDIPYEFAYIREV